MYPSSPDLQISPIISGYRWLRAGRDLWRQAYNPKTRGFRPVAGWRMASRELAIAMFEKMGYYGGEEEMRRALELDEEFDRLEAAAACAEAIESEWMAREKILKFPVAG